MARFLAEVNSTSVRDLNRADDCNGDSKADYALFDASTLSTATWHLNNNVYVSGLSGQTLPAGWSLVAPATLAPTATLTPGRRLRRNLSPRAGRMPLRRRGRSPGDEYGVERVVLNALVRQLPDAFAA